MMLQECASTEAAAGLHGSKSVRVAALRALRLLYEAVNDAQALSYVLPGAVGGLSKALIQGVPTILLAARVFIVCTSTYTYGSINQ